MRLITFKYDIFDYFKSCHYKYQAKQAFFKCPSHSLLHLFQMHIIIPDEEEILILLCVCVCVHAYTCTYTDAWGAHMYVCELVFGLSEDQE